MINTGSFDPLTPTENEEFAQHCEAFKQAVSDSDATDAFDFEQKYYLQKIKGRWAMTKPGSNTAFADIVVSSPGVMEALLNYALANFRANETAAI